MATHQAGGEELLVHNWRVTRLTRLGVPRVAGRGHDERTREAARTGRRSLAAWGR